VHGKKAILLTAKLHGRLYADWCDNYIIEPIIFSILGDALSN
jgi:hypothetical protein